MQHGSPVQGLGETKGVGELLGQGQRRLAAGHRLIGVPEEPEGRRRAIVTAHPRVVPTVERGIGMVPLRVVEPQPLFLVRPGGGQLAATEQAGPQGMVGLQQEVRVVQTLGQAEELLPRLPASSGSRRARYTPTRVPTGRGRAASVLRSAHTARGRG